MYNLSLIEAELLYASAQKASDNAYAPYSHFKVGAAVLLNDGSIVTGTNVENASYGLTICAERVALGAAFAADPQNIVAIAVHTHLPSAAPCGACRQFIFEAGADVSVVFRNEGALTIRSISELLPFAFSSKHLSQNPI